MYPGRKLKEINEMKILHILDHSVPLHSGYTFRSQNIFKAQKKMGFDPVVLTSPKHEESLKQNTLACETVNNIKYYRTGLSPQYPVPVLPELLLIANYSRLLFLQPAYCQTFCWLLFVKRTYNFPIHSNLFKYYYFRRILTS